MGLWSVIPRFVSSNNVSAYFLFSKCEMRSSFAVSRQTIMLNLTRAITAVFKVHTHRKKVTSISSFVVERDNLEGTERRKN